MKKSIRLTFIIFLMIFWGLNQVVEARIGTSSSSSSSSSRSSSSSSRSSSSSSSSRSSSSSYSRPSSKTDSIFSNTAKTNQARDAWQQRNKPTTVTPPVTSNPYPSTRNPPTPNPSYRYDSNPASDAIQKQLSDMRTEQRLIGLGQVFSQWLFSKNRDTPRTTTPRPPVTNQPNLTNNTVTPNVLNPTTTNTPTPNSNNTPVANTPTPVVEKPVTPEKPDDGFPWFKTILFGGLGYWLFSWWKKSVTPVTNYKL